MFQPNNFALQIRAFQKSQELRFRPLWERFREHPFVQRSFLFGSGLVLAGALFLVLCNLLGIFIASLAILFVLERGFGLRFQPLF